MGAEKTLPCKKTKKNLQAFYCSEISRMLLSVCRSQRGHSYHIKNNHGQPSHGGTFSSSQRSSSSDCSGINPHTAAHSSAETKSSTLTQPPSPPPPALIPPSSEPGRHQPPQSHKGTKGRRRGGEQKTKPNRKKKTLEDTRK